MSISRIGTVEEEVHPGLEVPLRRRLFLAGHRGRLLFRQSYRVAERHRLRDQDLLFAGSCQAEVLTGRQIEIGVGVVIFILKLEIRISELLYLVLLLQGGYLPL